MNVKIIYLMYVLCFINFFCSAMQIKGKVTDSFNGNPIEFVNIGIKIKNIGTITNERGEFIITINDTLASESLTFSCIGYKSKTAQIQNLRISSRLVIITLEPDVQILNEVKIEALRMKEKSLGIKAHNPFLWGSAISDNIGDIIEVAQTIAVKNRVTRILSAHIYLNAAPADSGTFRLNFYYLKNGKPDSLAIKKSIIRTLALKKGWINIDVSHESIYLKRDFAFAFEYLPTGKRLLEKHELMYGGKLAGNDGYFRLSSQGDWQKSRGAVYSMYLNVKK